MTTPSKDDVLRVAQECGAMTGTGSIQFRLDGSLERFAAAMYAAGQESAKADGWRQCAVGQHTSQFCAMAEKARVEGAEGMRERVVVSANKEVSDWEVLRDISVARKESSIIESTNILAINRLIEAIRALPITPTNTEGEQG